MRLQKSTLHPQRPSSAPQKKRTSQVENHWRKPSVTLCMSCRTHTILLTTSGRFLPISGPDFSPGPPWHLVSKSVFRPKANNKQTRHKDRKHQNYYSSVWLLLASMSLYGKMGCDNMQRREMTTHYMSQHELLTWVGTNQIRIFYTLVVLQESGLHGLSLRLQFFTNSRAFD